MNRYKVREAGRKFGYVCIGLGIIVILLTMPLIENHSNEGCPINIVPAIVEILGVALYLYGAWRTGYTKEK